MRFTSRIRLPSHLILVLASTPLLTLASPTTSFTNTTTSWCLSTTTGTGPLYLFNPTKSCSDQIVTFTPEIMQATDICHSTFQKYQFKMCGKNVTLSVNSGPKSVLGAKQMGCGLVIDVDGERFQGKPTSERGDGGRCYSKSCGNGKKGIREVFGVFEWLGLPICGD